MHRDQFCLTFGKENWNTVQVNKPNQTNLVSTPVKNRMNKSDDDSTISKTARTTSSSLNKTTPKKSHFFK